MDGQDMQDEGMIAMMLCPAPLDSRLRGNDEVGGDLNHDCHDLGMIAMMLCTSPLDSRLRGNDGGGRGMTGVMGI